MQEQEARLRRKLYFYLWVSPDFQTNEAIKVHKACLTKYIDVFDERTFIVAVDDFRNEAQINEGLSWVKEICGDRPFNVKLALNNKELCEVGTFGEYFLPAMEMGERCMMFFSHSKGIMDTNDMWKNKYSVLRWVISMYYYNLEYVDEAESYLLNGKVFYGALRTRFDRRDNSGIMTHGNIYIGTFYWFNPANAKKNMIMKLSEMPMAFNRWTAEDFPMLFNIESLSSHNNVVTENTIFDLFYLRKDYWPLYLNLYGDPDKLFGMQNDIIKSACWVEGY